PTPTRAGRGSSATNRTGTFPPPGPAESAPSRSCAAVPPVTPSWRKPSPPTRRFAPITSSTRSRIWFRSSSPPPTHLRPRSRLRGRRKDDHDPLGTATTRRSHPNTQRRFLRIRPAATLPRRSVEFAEADDPRSVHDALRRRRHRRLGAARDLGRPAGARGLLLLLHRRRPRRAAQPGLGRPRRSPR